MSYLSVDELQKILTRDVFHYARDRKKAAGRALGTLVEVITFYTLKSWGLGEYVAIERSLPEYANHEITHNVEYSLHPCSKVAAVEFSVAGAPITTAKILRKCGAVAAGLGEIQVRSNQLLSKSGVLRNACNLGDLPGGFVLANLAAIEKAKYKVDVCVLRQTPFAVFECKRVGIEEGNKKGPQTIEKAKQGAYVARTISSLQKIRLNDGKIGGVIQLPSGELLSGNYAAMLDEMISSDRKDLLRDFVMTVGVVSNHGNWFTSTNHNKELKVLAQSYDWLLFLTDAGLAEFVSDLLLKPRDELRCVGQAFLASYTGQTACNRFTKVKMDLAAHVALERYFAANLGRVEAWYNVITPKARRLGGLRQAVETLAGKNWEEIRR